MKISKKIYNINIFAQMDKKKNLKKVLAYLTFLEKVESQKDLAEKIGVNSTNLSSAMNGNEMYLTNGLFKKILAKFPETDFIINNDFTHYPNSNNKGYNSTDDNSQNNINENNIYTEMIATQRELIDSLKEQISQYRKEIEYLRQRIIKEK